jgi:hypothetical protein
MSLLPQVDCQRIEIGPCALTIVGKPMVAAAPAVTAAVFKKLRRETFSSFVFLSFLIMYSSLMSLDLIFFLSKILISHET